MANVDAYLAGNGDFSSDFFVGDVPPVATIALLSIVQNGIACFRLTFSVPPLQLDVEGPSDALNPENYKTVGPKPLLVSSVVSVAGDPNSVDVYLTESLVSGSWTLKVENVEAA